MMRDNHSSTSDLDAQDVLGNDQKVLNEGRSSGQTRNISTPTCIPAAATKQDNHTAARALPTISKLLASRS
jgi:hypothetical protein